MECPHLSILDNLSTSQNLRTILGANSQSGVKLNQQTDQVRPQPPSSRGTRSGRSATANNIKQHHCNVCKSERSPWMCVLCGQVHCGRYVNSHARKHFLENNQHFLAICCHSRAAFCYECDDYVMNESASKRLIRALEQIQNNQGGADKGAKRPNDSRLSSSMKASLKSKRIKLAGIRNLGNTCFMNSVLQCLSNIPLFTSSVGDPPNGKSIIDAANNGAGLYKRRLIQIATNSSKPELLFETLRNTIYQLKKSGKSFIIPESLFTMVGKNPRFRGYQQQDAHEFLRYVLDRLDKECLENRPDLERDQDDSNSSSSYVSRLNKKSTKNHASMIGNIFGGILQNEVNCLECGYKSHKQDPFLDLSLDIPLQRKSNSTGSNNSSDVTPNSHNSDNSNSSSSNLASETTNVSQSSPDGICDLMDCLLSFIELEELTETELYYCSNCQKRRKSTKRFWIRRLPDVLCLHLKRFRYNNYLRTKIDDYIRFPTQGLDMKRFVITNKHETRGSSCGPTTYDLMAFIEHHGSGLGSGHYTAYCRHDGYWFHFDDSSVRACEESTVKQSKAYILFYSRRTTTSTNTTTTAS